MKTCYVISHSASGYPIVVFTDESAAFAAIPEWAAREGYKEKDVGVIEYPFIQGGDAAPTEPIPEPTDAEIDDLASDYISGHREERRELIRAALAKWGQQSLLQEAVGWLAEYEASCEFTDEARNDLRDLIGRCDAAVGNPQDDYGESEQPHPSD